MDRRRLVKIAAMLGAGLALIGAGLLLGIVLPDGSEEYYDSVGHRKEDPEAGLVIVGAILVVVAVVDAVIRIVRGPQSPGKRARD